MRARLRKCLVCPRISGPHGASTTIASAALVEGAALNGAAAGLSATEGVPLVSAVVATFSDADTAASAADYSAWIDWGDGHVSAGVVNPVQGTPGAYQVLGSHDYMEEVPAPLTDTVTIEDEADSKLVVQSQVTVADAPLAVTNVLQGTHIVRVSLSETPAALAA